VNFAAITLCVASQEVFIFVPVKCDPRFSVISEMANLKKQHPNGEKALLPGGFEASEGASPPKTSGTMAETGLVASP
jgi:hypothetical protein